jgi:DNA-binding XRE family transcriptional regulator
MTKLKKCLAARGLIQTWVAGEAGIDHREFNKMVNGHIEPNAEGKKRLAELLNVEVKDIWPEEVTNES